MRRLDGGHLIQRFAQLLIAMPLAMATPVGCHSRPDSFPSTPKVTRPGEASLLAPSGDGRARHYVIFRRARGDSTDRVFGHWTLTERPRGPGRADTLVRDNVWDLDSSVVIDSLATTRRGLRPIYEVRRQKATILAITFDGSAVTTHEASDTGSARVTRKELAEAAFNLSDVDLVVRTVVASLRASVVLPFYDPRTGRIELDTLRPGSDTSLTVGGARSRARTLFFADPTITATFWIDRSTQVLLREDITQRISLTQFTIELQTEACDADNATRSPAVLNAKECVESPVASSTNPRCTNERPAAQCRRRS